MSSVEPATVGKVSVVQPVAHVPQWFFPGVDWASLVPAGPTNLGKNI